MKLRYIILGHIIAMAIGVLITIAILKWWIL